MIRVKGPGWVALDYGPTQMNIQVSGDDADSSVAEEAALYAIQVVKELAAFKSVAFRPHRKIKEVSSLPEVLQRMILAVQAAGDADLTPMAAVAGAVADMTADWLVERGIPKIIVNNGGDIAIRLSGELTVTVGIAPAIDLPATHTFKVCAADNIGGVTTSGLGGRSFTKGIATATTILGRTAAIADACASSVGNATNADHPAIRRVLAETVDPLTDLVGHWVVKEVGELPPEVVVEALHSGWRRAKELYSQGLIQGAAIFIGHWGIMLPETLAVPRKDINIEEGLQWKFVK